MINPKIRRRQSNDQGFALPLVMGMGLAMILVTTTLIHQAQREQVSAASQARSEDALSAAEAGLARVQAYLHHQRALATHSLAHWPQVLAQLDHDQQACPTGTWRNSFNQGQQYAQGAWLPTADPRQQYRVVDYAYDPQVNQQGQVGVATLTVEGQVSSGLRPTTSRLVVEIPIAINTNAHGQIRQPPPPAIWAKNLHINRTNKIAGAVRVQTCTTPPTGIATDNLQLNPVGQPLGNISADIYPLFPQPYQVPPTAINLPVIKTSLTLPRPGDPPDAQGNFHYAIAADRRDYAIQLADDQHLAIQVTAGQTVNLYAQGNIDLGGSQVSVSVDQSTASHPEKLRIYGSDRTHKFFVKDSARVTAFIHAPQAIGQGIGTSAGGTITPNTGITGGLWLQQWDTETYSSHISIQQQGTWSELGIAPEAQMGLRLQPFRSWQRQEQP